SPPRRACWAKRGKQREIVISGRNGRRVIHGAVRAATGELVRLVRLVRERSRQDDCITCLEALARVRPQVPTLLIWDNAPPHHPKRVLAAAEAAHVTIAWLPFRSPELNPLADLWRLLKAEIAANRVYDVMDTLADHALAWLDRLPAAEVLRKCGLLGSK